MKRAAHPGALRLSLLGLFLLSLSTTAALSATGCDEASTISASHLRYARMSHNSTGYPNHEDNCRAFIKQFVEAVEARQVTATCQDSVARRRSLEILDGEIQTFNERIAEQSCRP